jgi:fermentation-respiration switch protein FrsA (DUF1100 family)
MAVPRTLNQIASLCILSLFVFFYLRYIERRTIFYPDKKIEFLPRDVGLNSEEVFFNTSDGIQISAWFVPHPQARHTILFAHGNAGNISHRIEKLKFFYDLGCNILIFDYRGYGKSQGRPSEKGIYLDAKAAYDYLLSRHISADAIIGYGESIGGAVVIDLAYKNKLGGLIVDGCFSCAKDMAKFIYPFIPYWVFSSRFNSEAKISSIKIPKLIIHSVNDEIVPYKLGHKLYGSALEPKEFLQIRGGHNSCFYESEEILREKVGDFLKRIPR